MQIVTNCDAIPAKLAGRDGGVRRHTATEAHDRGLGTSRSPGTSEQAEHVLRLPRGHPPKKAKNKRPENKEMMGKMAKSGFFFFVYTLLWVVFLEERSPNPPRDSRRRLDRRPAIYITRPSQKFGRRG